MAVEFNVLGQVEARVDGQQLALGHARQRGVLAALLVDANRLVALDQLVERVWGGRPPSGVRATLYGYISRLRQVLPAESDVEIARRSGGYLIAVDEAALDVHRFHHLAGEARSTLDEERALGSYGRALDLWRGVAFAGLDSPWFTMVREELERHRIAVELEHADLALRRGRHNELLAALSSRIAARPLDERLAGQLMLALYRAGRQAEALEHYERTRVRLAEELGADPSRPLQRLHQRILNTDPALGSTFEVVEQASRSAPPVVPRQLPAPPRLFTGRTDEIAYLTAAADGEDSPLRTVVISAIGGTGGIGKTSLALQWAHTHLDRFPDGQLYADLRGFGPDPEPLPPAVVVRGFLEALGVASNAMPADTDGQAALYRSLVTDRRLLIVLDNARDTAQVVPLLPGSPACTVLVTSRNQLAGLTVTHGARPLTLDILSGTEARELLTGHLGQERVDAEPEAVSTFVDRCAGLPLALGIVAARAVIQVRLPLRALAEELQDTSTRLDALDAGELGVNLRAVFSWSYHALPPEVAEVFRLLGLAPSSDTGLAAAASLTAKPIPRLRELLRRLEAASLVYQQAPGHYRLHDLVYLYAAEQAHRTHSLAVRDAVLRRLVDFYLHTAYAADRLLDPRRPPVALGQSAPGCLPHPLRDAAEAMAWFDIEHSHLLEAQQVAVEQGWHSQVWQLARTLATFHARRRRSPDQIEVWRVAVVAADKQGDPAVQALAYRFLGQASTGVGDDNAAFNNLRTALVWSEQAGDAAEQARAHYALAVAWERHGDCQRALTHAYEALRLFEGLNDPVEEARALNAVGWVHAHLTQYEDAHAACDRALALFRRHRHPDGEADTLHSLGYVAQHTGQHAEALAYFSQALTVYREVGNTRGEVDSLSSLGEVYTSLGRYIEAHDAWRQTVDLLQAQHRVAEADRLREQLATRAAASGGVVCTDRTCAIHGPRHPRHGEPVGNGRR